MEIRRKPLICMIVCLIGLLISYSFVPTYSKYVLEEFGELLHTIITGPKLTVTFKNGDEVVNIITADFNEEITISHARPDNITPPEPDAEWVGWVNALGVTVPTKVKVTKNVVFNAKWILKDYYVRFLDLDGHIVHEEPIDKTNRTINIDSNDQTKLNNLLIEMESSLNTAEMDSYGISFTVTYDIQGISIPNPVTDVYVSPDVSFGTNENVDASIQLSPQVDSNGNIIDANGDGFPDGFIVSGASFDDDNVNITIPSEIMGVPIVAIAENSFAGFDNLHAIRIPKSITAIGATSFSDESLSWFNSGETITIYYEGSKAEWEAIYKASGWDDGLSKSTNIFFLNGGDKVDSSQGYLKRKTNWLGQGDGWENKTSLDSSFNSDYQAACDCDIDACKCNCGVVGCEKRPDHIYWPAR